MAFINDVVTFAGAGTPAARSQSTGVDGAWPMGYPDFTVAMSQTYDRRPYSFHGDAVLLHDFAEDLIYNRMWITPEIDFGTIIEDVTDYVNIWNAYPTAKTLSAVDDPDNDGVDVGYTAPPVVLSINEELRYIAAVYTNGPAEQDSVYGWTVDGTVYYTSIIGTRVAVFPFMPNWKQGVNFGYGFQTVIATARNKFEQRRSQFASPKRTVSFHMDEKEITQQKFVNFTRTNMARYVAANIYHELFWTEGTLQGEVDIVSAVDLTYFFNLQHLSTKLAIIDPLTNIGELKSIESITGDTVTVTDAVVHDFDPTTAVIMPIFVAVINNHTHDHITSTFTGANFKFNEVYLGLGDTSPPAVPETTQTLPSIVVPDMKTGIKRKTLDSRDIIEFFGGAPTVLSQTDRRPEIFSFKDFVNGRENVYALEHFFCEHRGRLARFWFDMPLNDFELTTSFGADAAQMYVRRNGYQGCWSEDDYLYLLLQNGNWYRRRITDVAEDDDADELTLVLESSIPEAVAPADIVYLGRSYVTRFDLDTLTMAFANVEVASVGFRMYELPNERSNVT